MADDWDSRGQALLDQASASWRQGHRDDAEALFLQLADEYPDRPEPYNKLGVVYAEMGELDQAEQWFRRALQIEKDHPPALTNLGNILLERGQVDEAMAYYGLALQRNPEYAPAHRNLAVALRRQGDLRGSVRHLRHSERLAVRQDREQARNQLFGKRKSPSAAPAADRATARGGFSSTGLSWWWIVAVLLGLFVVARYLHHVPR
jgi:tetratricopeptide (TPR) repeat protein